MVSLLENAKFYSSLFQNFDMGKKMPELFAEAISLVKALGTEERSQA